MAVLKSGDLFPQEVVNEIFSKVKGHSTLSRLSNQEPIPFTGREEFIFNLNGNAQIVGEGELKKDGGAVLTSKVIKPVKIVYQARFTDEFKNAAEEKQLQYLQSFIDGYAVKVAEAFDIAALHGLEPQSMEEASFKATNSFDGLVTDNVVQYDAALIEDNLESAIEQIVTSNGDVSGLALSPRASSALGKVKVNDVVQYPEFRFGRRPSEFNGMTVDVNKTLITVGAGGDKDHAIVGDFANSFKWGYAENVPLEIIEYGDPDGTGRDLKAYNEILLRAEAYIGWGILVPENFGRVVEAGA